jgi:OOP family OmpA-OmpF porin
MFAPAPAAAPAPITTTVILHGVNFATESADLIGQSFEVLDDIVARMNHYADLRIEVAGHTDNQGDPDFNRSLSFNRARAVVSYLVSRGIDRSRLVARGYGMERPIASNDTEDGRAQNRRVEVVPLQ